VHVIGTVTRKAECVRFWSGGRRVTPDFAGNGFRHF
jgi:hypothetical protein